MMDQREQCIHPNVIIHMDIDYFYAQVEEVKNPELKNKPLGVQQGTNIVTCNYIARSFGVKKWRPLKESLEKCPELVVVNGEDLNDYKIYSKKISELLHSLVGPSERMGLDEHHIDITKIVQTQLSTMSELEVNNLHFTGPFYPSEDAFSECQCGCVKKLMVGSHIAHKIREKILHELKLTCSVGIAHNKLLAKLVGQINKPENQTVLAPLSAAQFMIELKDLRSITGIGDKTATRLEEIGIKTIEELQNCDISLLQRNFGGETALRLKEMSIGDDSSEVRPSGKPKTVGLEDSCSPISLRSDAIDMFQNLLPRLILQIQDDGRIPQSIKITVRKYDKEKKLSIRETKQCALLSSQFKFVEGNLRLADGAHERIMKEIMDMFDHLTSAKQPLFINLIGLCFGKFQELKKGTASIESFLTKKKRSLESEITNSTEYNDEFQKDEQLPRKHKLDEASIDLKPSAKRRKTECSQDEPHSEMQKAKPTSNVCLTLPLIRTPLPSSSQIDPSVWKELPEDVQRELMRSWTLTQNIVTSTSSTTNSNSLESRCKENLLMKHLMRK